MPFEIMNQRGISASSHLFEDNSFFPERSVGLQKPKSFHDHYLQGKLGASPRGISSTSSSLEMSANSGLPMSQTSLSGEVTEKLHVGGGGIIDVLKSTKESMNQHPRSWSNVRVHMQPESTSYNGKKILTDTASHESSLFSSSLSEIFSQKCKILFHVNASRSSMYHGKCCKLDSSAWPLSFQVP